MIQIFEEKLDTVNITMMAIENDSIIAESKYRIGSGISMIEAEVDIMDQLRVTKKGSKVYFSRWGIIAL